MAPRGIYYDIKANFTSAATITKYEKGDLREKLFNLNNDETLGDGQKKLYSLMCDFVLNNNLVYISSAPGNRWIRALIDIGYKKTVLSIDPRPLEILKDVSFEIVHIMEAIHTSGRLFELYVEHMKEIGPCDLIWDVRSDYTNDEQYLKMIGKEILICNNIIREFDYMRRYMVKVYSPLINEYVFHHNTRFILQPFIILETIDQERTNSGL